MGVSEAQFFQKLGWFPRPESRCLARPSFKLACSPRSSTIIIGAVRRGGGVHVLVDDTRAVDAAARQRMFCPDVHELVLFKGQLT